MHVRTVLAAALAAACGILPTAPSYAHFDITVPGCYGVGPAVVCDIVISAGPLESVGITMVPVPVCTGTCTYVGVPVPDVVVDRTHPICATWRDLAGTQTSQCWRAPA